ncbi:class I SAM-dependent methyltransferase [Streptomyces sp. SID13666]|uniref:SAM-dependent methyltransferase n=1 Tax=unclassified Streptomyces TaxID=2593676 RepID=UPI001106CF35|nr:MULTISPECIES: class I SAM-dependent methyltransferase [unclassified Streptomyces]NEA57183.1 class I SAM-dependent methyltransferase [Streptomyces sp. SID13666]NEA74277.1 class I SAM-dependent methyltransferase [Streptomyces sp. SID13588]QNA71963.1 class I SAM-dependent methyltransferase [Streptomyces sp. So13.3]
MDALTLSKVIRQRQIPLLLSLTRNLVTPLYRATFLASAASRGVLRRMAVRPCDLETLAEHLGIHGDAAPLRAWLDIGVQLGDLSWSDDAYRLRSRTAKALARAGQDSVAAALEEVLRFHVPVLLDAPDMLRDGRRLSLSDQDGAVIARSTRVVQPFVEEAVAHTLDRTTPVRLLEVGCGSGVYVRHAASLNPRLTALAIDLQGDVAKQAAENMTEWGLQDRVETRQGDIRTLELEPQFDLITLHNNIYYFPRDERTAVLERARALLAPGGKVLLTTSCQGGNVGLEVLNLWFTYADFGGPLPREDELTGQLERAGYTDVTARRIIPGEQFRAFVGTNARAAQI